MKFLQRFKMIIYLLRMEVNSDMVTVYVTLIVRGYKTYSQVPDTLKPQVKAELEALELGELAQ
ncbi:CD1375 family protein [Fictibacillus phosphorivorans]|uniref:CD1375 family protein n=1 Tax=Fictibacillus phosphorivorans TaxID=1221500 RepID=UPI0012E83C57|nr:CD1375 family protein [Fictibacillus phosphorivorans]